MMNIDIMTLFPDMCKAVLAQSIIGRAIKNGHMKINFHQIRDFAFDKHKRVDDTPCGGGNGMIMIPEPISRCFEHICEIRKTRPYLIYMSPKGKVLNQEIAKNIVKRHNMLAILCGRYEGVDQRVIDKFVDEEISIGDYVLTGGEVPAIVLTEVICRMIPGVLSNDECFEVESHYNGFLEYPQYTKPAVWREIPVPEVLLSGHKGNIERWKKEMSVLETVKKRPEIFLKNIKNHKIR